MVVGILTWHLLHHRQPFCLRRQTTTFVDIPIRAGLIFFITDSHTHIHSHPSGGGDAQFNTTHWSVVLLAGRSQNSQAESALESLCRSYWYPLYVYVRRKGYSSDDAQDLTQDFFTRLLEKNYFKLAAPGRGRFRSFLLKSLNHFLVNDWVRQKAQKRGGGQSVISMDEEDAERLYQRETASPASAENLYDKRWALALLDGAVKRLRTEYSRAGKGDLFDCLRELILTEASGERFHAIGAALGMNEGAVKVALHRLRARFETSFARKWRRQFQHLPRSTRTCAAS